MLVELNREKIIDKKDFDYNILLNVPKKVIFHLISKFRACKFFYDFEYYYAADNNPLFLNPIVLFDDSDLSFPKTEFRSDNFITKIIISVQI